MKILKVGLCAFGMSGKVFHAPFIEEHPGFILSAIVERNKEDSKTKYPNAYIYKSVEEMLQNEDIDIVVVNTPVQTHFEYVKMALYAGKNVIVEKPFTVDFAEAEVLVKLAKEKGLSLSVYQNRRFDRDFLQVKDIINQNKIGSIKEIEIRFDRYRTYASGKDHKENPSKKGAGALHDLGSHLIDQAIQLLGFPEKIFADVFTMKGKEFANDYFEILLYYKNDIRLRLKSSVFTKEAHFAYAIHGDRGSFLQERSDKQEEELVAGAVPIYGEDWIKPLGNTDGILNYLDNNSETIRVLTKSKPGNYMYYYQQIYEHFVFGYQLPSPGEEIIQNMKIIDVAQKSSELGEVICL